VCIRVDPWPIPLQTADFFWQTCFDTRVQADFAVELGANDEVMELPWSAPDGNGPRYYDLKRQPELLLNIQEAFENRELGEFLTAINSRNSILETSKCDVWTSRELNEEEQVYQAGCKFASYVDLVFSERTPQASFDAHENLAKEICALLKRAPEISAAAGFVVRRCYYRARAESEAEHSEGFGITFYLSGYGDDEQEARRRWMIGLKLVENALLQLSAAHRRKIGAGS
jgi:hypothetical protein